MTRPAKPDFSLSKPPRRIALIATWTIVSLSLALVVGALLVLTGRFPLLSLSRSDRIDLGIVLFVAPVLALVFAVVLEAARIAIERPDLPDRADRQVVDWSPGRREG